MRFRASFMIRTRVSVRVWTSASVDIGFRSRIRTVLTLGLSLALGSPLG